MRNREGKARFCLIVCLSIILGIMCYAPASAVTVSIPTGLKGIQGKTALVPVRIDTSVSLSGYLLDVTYDPNVLQFSGVLSIANLIMDDEDIPDPNVTLEDLVAVNVDPNVGKVSIGVINFYPLAVTGDLLHLKFMVKSVATDSAIIPSIEPGTGNDLSGADISAGSITTTLSAPSGKCQIDAVIDPGSLPDRVLVNLKGATSLDVAVNQNYYWSKFSDPNVVNFVVDPGRYQIIAKSEGYATFYTGYFDCNSNDSLTKTILITKPLKPSYAVSRKDIVTDPNKPKVRLTFTFIDTDGEPVAWDTFNYSLNLKFFNASNDSDHNGRVDTAALKNPSGPSKVFTSTVNGKFVYTVDLSDPNFRMTDGTDPNIDLGLAYDAYVFAFRTERGATWTDPNSSFLDPNKVRIHRYVVRAVNTANTKVAAQAKTSANLRDEIATKGYFDIQMDTNSVNDPAVYNIIKDVDPNNDVQSLNLEFDASFVDIDLFTTAADPNTALDPNTDVDISVEYNTGANFGLSSSDPGVGDPNDMFVVSIEFTDADGDTVLYNPDSDNWVAGVPLIYFDMPLPGPLQDPNLTPEEIMSDYLITTSAQKYSPDRYGLYYTTSGSNVPELFIPDAVGGTLSVFEQDGVMMATIGTPHASDWYVGEGPGPIPSGGGGGGTCFVNTLMND